MASFYSIDDHRRDRFQRNAIIGGVIGAGFLSLLNSTVRTKVIGGVLKGATKLTEHWEKRAGVSATTAGIEESSLFKNLQSFYRLVGSDVPKEARSAAAVNYLTSTGIGWSRQEAELLFQPSNTSYDLLRVRDAASSLGRPYYRKHVLPNLSRVGDLDFNAHVLGAVKAAREADVGAAVNDRVRLAHESMAALLQERAKARHGQLAKFTRWAGINQVSLREHIGSGFETKLRNVITNMPHPNRVSDNYRDVVRIMSGETTLSAGQLTAVRAAFSLHTSGVRNWEEVLGNLDVGLLSVGRNRFNLSRIGRAATSVFNKVADEFQIPIAPGLGGLQPLRFMPWARGRVKDFAGTISKGTRQRDLSEAFAARGVTGYFDNSNVLQQDVHFIGNKILGVEGTWKIFDARHGAIKDFVSIRNAEQATQGNTRRWMGNTFIGRLMDTLGLDSQHTPSIWSKYYSVINKTQFPDDPKYVNHPLNALRRIIAGSNHIDDVEAVLYAARQHTTIASTKATPKEVFNNVQSSLHPGFRKLIDENFSLQSMSTALKEIDTIMSGEADALATYFPAGTDASLFMGEHTKITARRFVQNPIDVLTQGLDTRAEPGLLNLEGLFGTPHKLSGESKLKDVFYEEILSQLSLGRSVADSSRDFSTILVNLQSIPALSRSKSGRDAAASVWASLSQKRIYRNITSQALESASVAEEIRTTRSQLLEDVINRYHGGLTPWVTPNLEEAAGPGASLYATPEGRNWLSGIFGAGKETWDRLADSSTYSRPDFLQHATEPFRALLRETVPGYGDSVHPGFLYHSAFRLNQMLAEYGLGLPAKDLQTAPSIMGNLFLKRILPVFGAVEAYKWINYQSDDITGTSPNELGANIRAHYHLGASYIGEKLGIVGAAKKLVELTPGLERWVTPRTYEEQQEYLTEGMEPVGRGRYWMTGSRTTFQGDKISYYTPSWYRLQSTNWQGAGNVDLNSSDYWSQSLLPTPSHPFSFLNRLLNPYAMDYKHSMGPNPDRPALLSSPAADPNTLWGNIFNATIGRIIKPTKVLHPEYMPGTLGYEEALSGGIGVGNDTIAVFSPSGRYEVYDKDSVGGELKAIGYAKAREDSNAAAGVGPGRTGIGGVRAGVVSPTTSKVYGAGYSPVQMGYNPYPNPASYAEPLWPDDPGVVAKRISKQTEDITGIYGFMSHSTLENMGVISQKESSPVLSQVNVTGWEDRFWGRDLGGLGGDISEWWRRVLIHKDRNRLEINPVPNSQPSWLPGDDGLINFRRGDPIGRLHRGATRLPGEAYEMLNANTILPMLRVRASSLGKSEEEIVDSIIGNKEPMTSYGEYVTAYGDETHKEIQQQWDREGMLIGSERRIYDKEHGISGHYDALLNINGEPVVGEIKTMGAKKFSTNRPYDENVTQINYYMKQLGTKRGVLYYVNRDDPSQVKTFDVNFNQGLYNETMAKAARAQQKVIDLISSGAISAGELYDPITKVAVLANTAPWSPEFKAARAEAIAFVQEENDPNIKASYQQRLNAAVKLGQSMKRQYILYDYKFNKPTVNKNFTIKKILDANTFQVEEDNHPLRLAGVRVSGERIQKWMKENNVRIEKGQTVLEAFYASHGIHIGGTVSTTIDPDNEISNDSLRTRRVTIGSLNRRLLKSGVGVEKPGDNSAPAILARYSFLQRMYGRLAEDTLHIDFPWLKKIFGVSSGLERYQREQVYGTRAGDWGHPWSTYVRPTLDAMAGRNPIAAALTGAIIGSFFFKSRGAKLYGAGFGGLLGLGLSIYGMLNTRGNDKYIPKRVEKRREIEEYYDTLNYLKYKRLENIYASKAREEDNIDVDRIVEERLEKGRLHKSAVRNLERQKREIKLDAEMEDETRKDLLSNINNKITTYDKWHRKTTRISRNAALALMYRQKAGRTLRGSEPGGALNDVLGGIPRYERELILNVISKGSSQERRELYHLLPKNQKAVVGPLLGIDKRTLPKKESLEKYFDTHQLPDATWQGWSESFDLNYARIRSAESEGVNPIEMNIYPRNEMDAEMATRDVPIPVIHGHTKDIKNTISAVLAERGIKDVQVQLQLSPSDQTRSDIDVDLKHKRDQEMIGIMAAAAVLNM